MEEARSLIFIPDISGFTDFVQQTEISHSEHIITELLEAIIDANILELKVAEIEGDAVFFYRKDFVPEPEELAIQVKNMFINFHSHLRSYDSYRICQCGACRTASNLSLKFIVHLGTFGFIKINKIEKPHGKDVILAHKLLKNTIDHREYLLLSENLLQAFPDKYPVLIKDSPELFEGSTNYKALGKVRYSYIILSPLHNEVKDPPEKIHPDKYSNPVHYSGFINAPKDKVFEIVSNLEYRMKINKDTSGLNYEKGRVNRAGLVHECIISNHNYQIQTVSNDFGKNKLVYGEMVENVFAVRKRYTYTILEDHGSSGTKLRYEVHLDMVPLIGWIMSPVIRLVILYQLKKLFIQLKEFSEKV